MPKVLGPNWKKVPFKEAAERLDAAGYSALANELRDWIAGFEHLERFIASDPGIPLRAIRATGHGADDLAAIDAAIKYCAPNLKLRREFERSLGGPRGRTTEGNELRSLLWIAIETPVRRRQRVGGALQNDRVSVLDLATSVDPAIFRDVLRRAFAKTMRDEARAVRTTKKDDKQPARDVDAQPVRRNARGIHEIVPMGVQSAGTPSLALTMSEVLAAVELVDIYRFVRSQVDAKGPAAKAALEHHLGQGSREALAKKYRVTPEAIRHAERHVQSAFRSARRSTA